MSLVGFKAQNHPQQIGRRGARTRVDDRAIHPHDFAAFDARFGFTIDAAASPENARLPRYWTAEDDALEQHWTGERIWCNPPYSHIAPWVSTAWHWFRGSTPPELVVMLLPANRTEQRWWQEYIEPYRDGREPLLRIEFLPGRMRFIMPGHTDIEPNQRPPFGCCLAIWGGDA